MPPLPPPRILPDHSGAWHLAAEPPSQDSPPPGFLPSLPAPLGGPLPPGRAALSRPLRISGSPRSLSFPSGHPSGVRAPARQGRCGGSGGARGSATQVAKGAETFGCTGRGGVVPTRSPCSLRSLQTSKARPRGSPAWPLSPHPGPGPGAEVRRKKVGTAGNSSVPGACGISGAAGTGDRGQGARRPSHANPSPPLSAQLSLWALGVAPDPLEINVARPPRVTVRVTPSLAIFPRKFLGSQGPEGQRGFTKPDLAEPLPFWGRARGSRASCHLSTAVVACWPLEKPGCPPPPPPCPGWSFPRAQGETRTETSHPPSTPAPSQGHPELPRGRRGQLGDW